MELQQAEKKGVESPKATTISRWGGRRERDCIWSMRFHQDSHAALHGPVWPRGFDQAKDRALADMEAALEGQDAAVLAQARMFCSW